MVLIALAGGAVDASPFTPASDGEVLAEVAPGTRHSELATRAMASRRLDVALPLAHFYLQQARATGDLRYLGYADAVLTPWIGSGAGSADALVLHATVLQSRHDFQGALSELSRALALRPDDPQAWLTSATVLRVLGRYDEALSACDRLGIKAVPTAVLLCSQGIRGLTGDLTSAYSAIAQIDPRGLSGEERAWRYSELGEMAVRLGLDDEAEHWFLNGIRTNESDFYIRAAYADLLLRKGRAREVPPLLDGRDSLEPLLLRIAIAQKILRDPAVHASSARLTAAFADETRRGDGVHRREEARFLLEVQGDPQAALAAAKANWQVQHETDDVLVLIAAARAAGIASAAAPALEFVRRHNIRDARIASVLGERS